MIVFFYLKKNQNLFKNSDVLDGDQKYKKSVEQWLWYLTPVFSWWWVLSPWGGSTTHNYGDLDSQTFSRWAGFFLSLKGDKWKRRVPVPVISKVCSCQRRVLSKDRRRQKFKGCSQTLCVSWWKLYHPTKTQDNFNAWSIIYIK